MRATASLAGLLVLLACKGHKTEPVPGDDTGTPEDIASQLDLDGDGFVGALDCDDDDPATYPGAAETSCDGIDQDCDGYDATDTDGDGYACGEDCDHEDPAVYPGAPEIFCDGIDQDCDGKDDDDQDDDGHECDEDCDDTDPTVHPGADEVYCDGIDQDCLGGDAEDEDADGYGCADDCDDKDPAVHPGVEETCDGVDQDCNGVTDDLLWHVDADGDGYGDPDTTVREAECEQPSGAVDDSGDCDDADAAVHPGVTETPGNGVDEDCDDYVDLDGATAWDAAVRWVGEQGRGVPWTGVQVTDALLDDLDGDGAPEPVVSIDPTLAVLWSSSAAAGGWLALRDTALLLADGDEADWESWDTPVQAAVGGDVDGDGVADLAVALSGEARGTAVALFAHADLATLTALSYDDAAAWITHDGSARTYALDALCWSKDLDGDGVGDLVIGDERAAEQAGATWIYRGSALTRGVALTGDDADWALKPASEKLGSGITPLPDLDGDGYPGFLVGDEGALYLVDGDALAGAKSLGVASLAFATVDWGDSGIPVGHAEPGDLDGDGREDVVLAHQGLTAIDGTSTNGFAAVWLSLGDGGGFTHEDAAAHVIDTSGDIDAMRAATALRAGGTDLVFSDDGDALLVPLEDLPLAGQLDLAGWSDRIDDDDEALISAGAHRGLLVVDIDADGDDDVLLSSPSANDGYTCTSHGCADLLYETTGVIAAFLNP